MQAASGADISPRANGAGPARRIDPCQRRRPALPLGRIASSRPALLETSFQVLDAAIQACELRIVFLRDTDAARLVQGNDEIQQVPRVEVHLVAEIASGSSGLLSASGAMLAKASRIGLAMSSFDIFATLRKKLPRLRWANLRGGVI
jgi:hypothetical protein